MRMATWCESIRPPSGIAVDCIGVLYLAAGLGAGLAGAGAGAALRTLALALLGALPLFDTRATTTVTFAVAPDLATRASYWSYESTTTQAHQVDPKGTPYCMHS